MSRRAGMICAGLCAGLGLSACHQGGITAAPAAIQVELESKGTTVETFTQLQDGGLSFGDDPVLIPVQQTLTVTNLGNGLLNIGQVFVTPDGGPFSVVGAIPTSVGGTSDEPLTIQFDPPQQEGYQATLEIVSDDTANPMVGIPLSGTGSTEGLLCVAPNPLDFGAVGQGQTVTSSISLTSCGTAVLDITSIELGDGGDPAFAIVSSNSIPDGGLFLAPDASIPFFDISFSPTASTPPTASGSLIIESSDPTHQPFVVGLAGQTVLAPIPVIQAPTIAAVGDTITLDGTKSYDPNNPPLDPLTYQWGFGQKLIDSNASLSNIDMSTTTITLDVVGTYNFTLEVWNDAGVESVMPALASVTAKPTDDLYVDMIWNNEAVDMDLHFLIDGGVFDGQGDCNAYEPDAGFSCVPSSDHLVGPGPESVAVPVPPAADYEVECKLYDAHDATSASTLVTVRVYIYGVLAAQVCQEMDMVGQIWPAVTIAWPSGTVTPVGTSVPCPETG